MKSLKMNSLKTSIFSILALSTAASLAESTIALEGESLFPESIAYDSASKRFLVGSAGNGSLLRVDLKGKVEVFQAAGLDGHQSLLGVKIDPSHGRLFVADGATVYIYDLKTNALLKKNAISDLGSFKESALNDFAFDKAGNAYVTDSFNPHLLKIDNKTLEMSVFRKLDMIPYGQQNDMPYNLNGIVLDRDGKSLISVKTNEGSLWRISLVSEEVTQIATSEALTKGDGLVRGKGNELFVIRNFENKISKILLNKKASTQNVIDVPASTLKIPTGAVYMGGKSPKLVITNSQFGVEKLEAFTLSVVEAK